MTRYSIGCETPASHLLQIVLTFEAHSEIVTLGLPVWRPGRYELANFSKNVMNVRATTGAGDVLPIKKISKSSWELLCRKGSEVRVSYTYYASQMDAGGSWVDDEQLYVNPVNCLMYLPERMNEPVELELSMPSTYRVASALVPEGNLLIAKSYYQLADSPLIASASLTHLSYEVSGITFHLCWHGTTDADSDRLTEDFRKFTQTQIGLFGDLPLKDYYFLFQFLPYTAYHGVEHADSTVITLGPCTGEHTGVFYEKLLGVSSHELFHAWNITRIRPAELTPYDFGRENYFETGYVAEGFTTYYGDLMLVRSGVYRQDWYLAELNNLLARHFQNFGRFNQSVAQSSFDLWLDGYQTGAPNRKVSIYVKGAIIALMLDLTIRLKSRGKHSLDDLMRKLWTDYYKQNKGYKKEDIRHLAELLCGEPMGNFFDQYVDGVTLVETELAWLVTAFGLELVSQLPESKHERDFGIKIKQNGEQLVVTHLHPESVAYGLLAVDDKIVGVNGAKAAEEMLAAFGGKTIISIVRQERPLQFTLESGGPYYESYSLRHKESASQEEQARLRQWITGEIR